MDSTRGRWALRWRKTRQWLATKRLAQMIKRPSQPGNKAFIGPLPARSHSRARARRMIKKTALIWGTGLAFLAFVGSLSLRNNLNDREMQSTEFRKLFAQNYRARLSGWRKDIEGNHTMANNIMYGLRAELMENPVDIEEIRVIPEEFFRKRWDEIQHFRSGVRGRAVDKSIIFDKLANTATIRHEIKHIRAFQQGFPLFYAWEKLCRMDGQSLFQTEIGPLENSARAGFITSYAQTNIHEDIAELCTYVEVFPEITHSIINSHPESKKIFLAKLKLAQQFHLIPSEATDFIEYAGSINLSLIEDMDGDVEDQSRVHELSRAYLAKHPKTVYGARVYVNMARVTANSELRKRLTLKVLEYPHDRYFYTLALEHLVVLTMGDPRHGPILREAFDLFVRRRESADPLLPIQGINDFLREKGIMK